MRILVSGLLAAVLPFAASAQAVAPMDGYWKARPIDREISGCDAELHGVLEQMANVMEANAGSFQIAWEDDQFNVDSLRRAQPDAEQAAWYQIADDLIVAIPRHRDAAPSDSPVKIWMRLIAADTFESHIMLDVTTLRTLENQPIAPGTETCKLHVTTVFEHDI